MPRREGRWAHTWGPSKKWLLQPLSGLLALACFPLLAAAQRGSAPPTPSPMASRFSGATPAPRGGGGRGAGGDDDDDDAGFSEECDADGGSAEYSEALA